LNFTVETCFFPVFRF